MLATETQFPQVGSRGFLRLAAFPTADGKPQPVRIQRRNADGTALISIEERFRKASSNRTVALADLAETTDEALPDTLGKLRKRSRKAR